MRGGEFVIDKKAMIYVIFFMVGIMIAIIVIESAKIPLNYIWLPLTLSIVGSTAAILYTVEDVKLHEVVLAAVAALIFSFISGVFGAISSALLLFQGISATLGYAAASASGLAASLFAASVAAPAVVVASATVLSPESAIAASSQTFDPLENIPGLKFYNKEHKHSYLGKIADFSQRRPANSDDDWTRVDGGRRVKKGGLRWRW
jgi:hypothetical protein